jgi:ABC transport system ATP-binding/permease protein
MHLRARLIAPTGEVLPVEVTADYIRLGRDSTCEVALPPAEYLQVSALHARLERFPGGVRLVPLSRQNTTLLNGHPADGPTLVKAGDRIRLGSTGPVLEVLSLSADGPTPPVEGDSTDATIRAGESHMKMLRGTAAARRFPLDDGGVFGRDLGKATYVLDHPHVSRRHAAARLDGGSVLLSDLGSPNGTFLNGSPVWEPTALAVGDRIDIGPFALTFDGSGFVGGSRANAIELATHNVGRVVTARGTGQLLPLLEGISLVFRPGEFVCLLGPSGSGKTTLLAMLSGRAAPSEGVVTVNGRDLYAHFAAHKQDIAVVPQKDLLHDTLPVGLALRYTAELRLPPDTGRAELGGAVEDILGVVGLADRSQTLIRHLSGGQLKRASLANELLGRPSLLFLDEVTSGLDEQTDREVMELFRLVAEGGKTVVCITHNLANVEATCGLVVILTAGGRLAFVGSPDEAKEYFRIPRLGEVYGKLSERPAEQWQAAFRASEWYQRYVQSRLPATPTPRLPSSPVPVAAALPSQPLPTPSPVRQAWVLARRYATVWRGDLPAAATLLGQTLLVGFLLAVVFGPLGDLSDPSERLPRTRSLLFLLGVSCFWFGCNTASKELVKERAIFVRERAVSVRPDSYFASKLVVLLSVAAVQATLLYAVVWTACQPAGAALGQWAFLVMLATVGTTVGLLLSAVAASEEVATALVPVVVIPQIVLAGVIAPLSGWTMWLAKLGVSTYSSQAGLERLLPDVDRTLLGIEADSVWVPAMAIGCQTLTFVGLAFLALKLPRHSQ